MEKSLRQQKFTQTNPATTIYWHTCKFTGKRFASPIRRCTYSPEGLRLKQEQDRLIKESAKQVCKIFFYRCRVTGKYFTTTTPFESLSPEGRLIAKQRNNARNINYNREHRKLPEVRERERLRSQARKEYRKAWHQRRAVAKQMSSPHDV